MLKWQYERLIEVVRPDVDRCVPATRVCAWLGVCVCVIWAPSPSSLPTTITNAARPPARMGCPGCYSASCCWHHMAACLLWHHDSAAKEMLFWGVMCCGVLFYTISRHAPDLNLYGLVCLLAAALPTFSPSTGWRTPTLGWQSGRRRGRLTWMRVRLTESAASSDQRWVEHSRGSWTP
jgi:hypothetical protein